MKNTELFRAIGGIDDDLIERAEPKAKAARVRSSAWLRWAAPVAACLVIAVAVALPALLRSPVSDHNSDPIEAMGGNQPVLNAEDSQPKTTAGTELMPARLDTIFGLPTSDYTWDEGNGVAADRMLTNELRYLMREFDSLDPDVKATFAVVKVEGAERFTDNENEWRSEGQIADCGVLYDVLGDGIVTPLKIKQRLYGGCTGEEQTNLLRVGGVYVLPLINWQNEDTWSVYGDLDCLFEVDDKGLIHSHSEFERLNKYDDVTLEKLWQDIEHLYRNPILRSRLAEYLSQGYEIESAANTIALVYPNMGWDEADAEGFSAKIGEDGRIVIATDGFNVFRPVEGMNMEALHQTISDIRQYIETEKSNPSEPRSTPIPADGPEDTPSTAVMSPDNARSILQEEYARQGFGEVSAELQAVTTLWRRVSFDPALSLCRNAFAVRHTVYNNRPETPRQTHERTMSE